MSLIGLSIGIEELSPVKVVELIGVFSKERMRDDINSAIRKTALLIIDTVTASEIGNTAFRGNTGAAQENNSLGLFDKIAKLLYLTFSGSFVPV